jgi:GNAT superfamily N-acetyltransferase
MSASTGEPLNDALEAMRANMRAFYRLLGERSPGGAVLERDGLLAAIVPACPNRSIVNAVVYDGVKALAANGEGLRAAYGRAGVHAWTVWVPEADGAAARLLEQWGHRLDAKPRGMTLELTGVDFDGAAELDWERTTDTGVVAAINEEAYGLPAGELASATTGVAGDPLGLYLARLDGASAACVATLDEKGDCGIYLVATARAAQRRGLASALMRQALLDARDRGCTTSSLQATKAGFPVYRRLGYQDVGAIEMWEWRASS